MRIREHPPKRMPFTMHALAWMVTNPCHGCEVICRLETSSLSCLQHGWRFAPSGKCTEIPQAETPERNARATASTRSCAIAYPLQAS